jgi:HK97 gp10 family phage protein
MARHAHLVEFGTGPRSLKKPRTVLLGGRMVTITHTGQMPARPFLRPAFDAAKREALDIFATEVWKELVKVSGRLAKKAGRGTLGKAQIRSLLR